MSKCSIVPAQRIRKLKRSIMKQIKVGVLFLVASSFFIILVLYWHSSYLGPGSQQSPTNTTHPLAATRRYKVVPMKHMNLDELYKDKNKEPKDNFLNGYKTGYSIHTIGCQIPFGMINYRKQIIYDKKLKQKRLDCGKRAVHIKKVDGDRVRATINPLVIKKYLRKSARFDCCYRFLQPRPGHDYTKIKFTTCKKFVTRDTIVLQTDFINVNCFEYDVRNKSRQIYDDVYAVTKKINLPPHGKKHCNSSYNVLILGMDSMSLPRVVQTMPRTTDFFNKNSWLCFRGYNKVGDNTFPNVMATLTGHSMPTISLECQGKMDQCNNKLMWSKFKDIGYVTAYGEDFLRLPDTFNNKLYAFRKPPTDHYIRPLFVKGEKELNSRVCAGKLSAGQHLLDYAVDFVTTYRNDRFFGFFWMNSFSHNPNSRPQDVDKLLENFLNRLTYTGILENTFIIFYSDHGIRFGPNRIELESYYDERLPSLFMLPPTKFKTRRWEEYKALVDNQFKLVTPYDLFNTLVNIKELSRCKNLSDVSVSRGCPKCHSLFMAVKTSRTCRDAAIHDKWCSCHQLYPLDNQDVQGIKSVLLAISHIKSIIKSTNTSRCWRCMNVSLRNVIRIHFYYKGSRDNIYYVVAFTTAPSNMAYEAIVNKSQIVGNLSIIKPYKSLIGDCAIDGPELARARLYCVCQRVKNCTKLL